MGIIFSKLFETLSQLFTKIKLFNNKTFYHPLFCMWKGESVNYTDDKSK